MHLRVHGRGTPGGYPVPRSPFHGIACGQEEQGGTPGGHPGWLCTVALLLMLFSALLVVIAGASSVQAHKAVRIETLTATPDANQVLNQANAVATQAASASSQANQASMEAQSMLNIFTTLITFAAFIIALVFAVLGIVGFGTIGDIRKQLLKGVERVDSVEAEAVEKKLAIERTQVALMHTQEALVYLSLGDRLFNQNEKQKAVEVYRKARNLLPEDPQINNTLGRIYSGVGYYDDAIQAFKAALSSDPNLAEAEMELGLAYRRRGDAQQGPDAKALLNADYDQAIAHLKRAVELRSTYEDALAGLGAVYRRMGDRERKLNNDAKAKEYYELARGYYDQAHNADPLSSYALGNVASLSWYLGRQDAAYDFFIDARSVAKVRLKTGGRTAEVFWDYYDLALAQLAIGTVDKNTAIKEEAIETYKTAIRLTPGSVQLDSVLNNLLLLQKSQQRIDKLDDVISMLEAAKAA